MLHKPSVITKYGAEYLVGTIATKGGSSSSSGPSGKNKIKFTMDEVAKHNNASDCWIVISDKVYDVSDFLNEHPGGKGAILMMAGKDATEEFEMLHRPEVLTKYGGKYFVGNLEK